MGLRQMESRLPPGFRFCPSDEELVCFYLRKKVANERVASGTLVEVDLHAREPWELPEVAKLTADEWYFFSLRDKKYATGSRTNRATKTGYWKATGKDRAVQDATARGTVVGMRKTLVFYTGRAPNGHKTGWVMHEYRLEAPGSLPKEDSVLCRVFNKAKASQTEQGGNISTNHAIITGSTGTGPSSPTTVSLGSSPDPSVADKFDGGHQLIGAAAAMSSSSISDTSLRLMHGDRHMGGSSYATLDLTMLQYYSLLEEYCTNPAMHDDMMAVRASHTGGCSAGSDRNSNDGMLELDLGLGHVGFGDHGMGEIEMEMEMENMQDGGSCYRDGSYL